MVGAGGEFDPNVVRYRDPRTGQFVKARISQRLAKSTAKIEWFGERVKKSIKIGTKTRIKTAAVLLRDRVVINLSRPVKKDVVRYRDVGGHRRTRTIVDPASRSVAGEFPRADTTRLMKDIFWQMDGETSAIVGTTLGYGLLLETQMSRSFLRRTLNEIAPLLRDILTIGPPSDFPGNNE